MEHIPYPPTDGSTLRALREGAGVSQDDIASAFEPRTTRQRVSRMEQDPRVPFVDATKYRAAIAVAVATKTGLDRRGAA